MADLASIMADDWRIMDDVRTATYYSRSGPSTFAAGVSVTDCLRRATDKNDQARPPGPLAQQQVDWHLWVARLGATVPKTTDVIEEADGSRWVVTKVDKLDEGQRYRCRCLKER